MLQLFKNELNCKAKILYYDDDPESYLAEVL